MMVLKLRCAFFDLKTLRFFCKLLLLATFGCLSTGLSLAAERPILNEAAGNQGWVSGSARRIVMDGIVFPAGGFYVPNSFTNSAADKWYVFLHGISRVRNKQLRSGCEPDCSDAIAYVEYDLTKGRKSSLSLQFSLHSLTGRNGGTSFGEGTSLGFKYARRIGPSSSLSFGGEHLFQFDDTVDLGRNFYLGFSRFFRLSMGRYIDGAGLLINVGLGSGIYSIYDNELLSFDSPIGGNNIFDDSDRLSFGIVGSASYYFSEKISVGFEYAGYGFGAGFSFKPLEGYPITSTLYLYDIIDDFPTGIPCAEDPCKPRLYGRLSFSF